MRPTRFIPTRAIVALTLLVAIPSNAPAQRSALIVTPAWLAAHLHDPDLVLLHVGDPKEYDKAHIAGARFVSQRDVSVSSHDDAGLMLEVPAPDSLRTQLQALGISDGSRVVVYYGGDWVSPSTRVMFTLDYAGFGNKSALLDGGLDAWKEAGLPITTDVPPKKVGKLGPLAVHPIVVDAKWVKPRLGTRGFHLIDGRSAVYYDGVEAGSSRKGHIASARSIPFTEVTDGKSRFKSAEALAALFRNAGIGDRDTVVAYCHIGQQATAVLFAARTLGHPVLLYDGSFQDWARRTELPVENPSETRKQ